MVAVFNKFFESLTTLPLNQILIMPRINSIANNVEGVFDCLFEKKTDSTHGTIIIWSVKDISIAMERQRKIQEVFKAKYM